MTVMGAFRPTFLPIDNLQGNCDDSTESVRPFMS